MTNHDHRAPLALKLDDTAAEQVRRSHAEAITALQGMPASGLRIITGVSLADGIATPIAHGLGRAVRWHARSSIRGLPSRISSTSTAVGVTTLTDSTQKMTTNAYAGGYLIDFSGQRYPILSNTATVFGVSNNGATPTAGAYVAFPPVGTIVEIRDGGVDPAKFIALQAFGWGTTISFDLAVA